MGNEGCFPKRTHVTLQDVTHLETRMKAAEIRLARLERRADADRPAEGGAEPSPWRTGRKLGRTIYGTDTDAFLGIMDTPELSARVVAAVNYMDNYVVVDTDAEPAGAAPHPLEEEVRERLERAEDAILAVMDQDWSCPFCNEEHRQYGHSDTCIGWQIHLRRQGLGRRHAHTEGSETP